MAREVEQGIDMDRMGTVLARHRRKYLSRMEDSPADQLLWTVLKHFLYSDRCATLPAM